MPSYLLAAMGRWDYGLVRGFLLGHGWSLVEEPPGGPAIFLHHVGAEVVVPIVSTKADFDLRVRELMKTLAQVHSATTERVERAILRTPCDEVYFSIAGPSTRDGTAPMRQALDSFAAFHRALVSAAIAEVTVARVQPTNPPSQAKRYMEETRVGGIERGSFRAVFLSQIGPTAEASEQQLLFNLDEAPPEPFSRRVLANLLRGTDAALLLSGEVEGESESDAVDARGLSANLCDALASLAEQAPPETIVLGVRPSPLLPTVLLDRRPRVLRPRAAEPLRECARRLKEIQPIESFPLRGRATSFTRAPGELMGTIHVRAQLPEGERTVRSVVFVPDFETAFQANVRELDIEATGRLERRGRSIWFEPDSPLREVGLNESGT